MNRTLTHCIADIALSTTTIGARCTECQVEELMPLLAEGSRATASASCGHPVQENLGLGCGDALRHTAASRRTDSRSPSSSSFSTV